MKINCDKCGAKYSIDDALLESGAIKVQCPACGDIRVLQASVTEPSSPPPLPDSSAGQREILSEQPQDPFDALDLDALDPPSISPQPVSALEPLSDSVSTGGSELESFSSEEKARCTRCGGLVQDSVGSDGLCSRCRSLLSTPVSSSGGIVSEDQRSWRVRKPDGIILGPLTLSEVKLKFHEEEVTAADQVACGEGDFKLISSFPEFSIFFRRHDVAQPVFRPAPPSHLLRNITIVLLVVFLFASGGAYLYWPQISSLWMQDSPLKGVLEEALESFSAQIPSPDGTSAEAVKKGQALMYHDDRLSYMEADRQFKSALLLDPTNMDAYWGWVQNRALMDYLSSDVTARKTGLDLVDYALERSPDNPDLIRAKGFLLWSLGRIDEARQLATKANSLDQNNADAMLLLGATYLDSSTDMAVDLFKKALEKKPDIAIAYRMLGEAKIRTGRFHEAIAFFDQRLDKDPSQFVSLEAKARIYLSVGKFKKAKKIFEQILGSEPHRVNALLALARIKYQVGKNIKAARMLLDGFLANSFDDLSDGDKAKLLTDKSIVLRLAGKFDEAKKLAQQASDLDSIFIPAKYAMAWSLLLTGDVGHSIVRFKDLRPHMPDSPRLLMLLAESAAEVPNYESAIKSYRQAVELDHSDLDAYLSFAVLHLYLDSVNMSYARLRRATKTDFFYSQNHLSLSAYYDGRSIWNLVLPRLKVAMSSRTDDPLALSLAGAVYWRSGYTDKALSSLKNALSIDEECFSANLFLGALLLDSGKPKKALKYLGKAYKEDSLNVTAGVLYSYALMQSAHAGKAVKIAKVMVKIDPGSLQARLCLAESWLAKGKKKTGLSKLLKVYKADSGNTRAKGLLFDLGY